MHYLKIYTKYAKKENLKYKQFLNDACSGDTDQMRVYNRLLFAFLSVNTSYDKTAKAYDDMKNKYWLDTTETMNKLLEHGIHYAASRAGYIALTSNDFISNYDSFLIGDCESWNDYRNRLVEKIKGLALVKVSFFITLVYKDADICCLDRWVLRLMGKKDPEKFMRLLAHRNRYQRLEAILRKQAQSIKIPLFQYQWAAWDKIQNKPNAMEVLHGS